MNRKKKIIDKIIAAISDYIQLEPMEITPASVLSFPGLEIRQTGTAMVICCTTKRPGNARKTLSALVLTVCICSPYSFFYKGLGNFPKTLPFLPPVRSK